jgi:hypothetical protein
MAKTFLIQTEENEHHIVVADTELSAKFILATHLMELLGDEEGKRLMYTAVVLVSWYQVDGCKLTFYAQHCICSARF